MTEPRTWTLSLPPGTPILTANNRMNPFARNKRVKELHEVAAGLVMVLRIPPLGLSDVLLEYQSPPRLRKDRHPLHSDCVLDSDALDTTRKALVDGLVRAGVWKSDTRRHVRRCTSELLPVTHPRGLVRLIITEVLP